MTCLYCGLPLVKRQKESLSGFASRLYCGPACRAHASPETLRCSWPDCNNKPVTTVATSQQSRWVCAVHEDNFEVPA